MQEEGHLKFLGGVIGLCIPWRLVSVSGQREFSVYLKRSWIFWNPLFGNYGEAGFSDIIRWRSIVCSGSVSMQRWVPKDINVLIYHIKKIGVIWCSPPLIVHTL